MERFDMELKANWPLNHFTAFISNMTFQSFKTNLLNLIIYAAVLYTCVFNTNSIAADKHTNKASSGEQQVFAKVLDTTITLEDFENSFATAARAKFYHGKPPTQEVAAMQREVGNKLVNDILLIHEAKRRKLLPDEELIKQQLDKLDQRYSNDDEWKKVRSTEIPKIRRQMQDRNLLAQLEKIVRNVPDPTEKQLKEYYANHLDKFTAPERQRVSLILIKVDPSSPNEEWQSAYEKAEKLEARLKKGEDFSELARKNSDDSTAEAGGDMGYLHKGMLSEAGEQKIGSLKPGEFSEPTVTMEGIAIFRLVERQAPKVNDFQDIQDRARGLWLTEQGKLAWESLIKSLRAQTPVKVNESIYLPLPSVTDNPKD